MHLKLMGYASNNFTGQERLQLLSDEFRESEVYN